MRQAWVKIDAMQDEACQEQGCKPCPDCEAWDCGTCSEWIYEKERSGSSHVSGCEREWIG